MDSMIEKLQKTKPIYIVLGGILISGIVIAQLGEEYHFYSNFIIIQALLLVMVIILLDKAITYNGLFASGAIFLILLLYIFMIFFDIKYDFNNIPLLLFKIALIFAICYYSYNYFQSSENNNPKTYIHYILVILLFLIHLVEFILDANKPPTDQ